MRGVRVLVTGGLGFIGSNVVRRCVGQGARVTVYDCLDPRSGGNIYNVHDVESDCEIVVNDVRNFEGLSACIRGQDIVFNCAGYTSHPNSMKDPLVDVDVNCKGTINLLEAGRRFNPEVKIVHVGTSTQIGRMRFSPITEEHPEFPLDIYSANRTAAEKYLLIYGSAYKMKTTVIRLANVFGPRSNIKSSEFGFMNYFIGCALKGQPLTIYGSGSQLRNISYVEDAVAALLLAAESDKSDGQVLFAVNDRQYQVKEIAEAIVDVIGGSVKTVEWPPERQVIEVGDMVLSNEKIKSLLGWRPQYELVAGLKETKAYFSGCLERYLA